jgi:hypothetical protein
MKKKAFHFLSTGTLLIGGMAWFIHLSMTASACGGANPQMASGSASAQIVHAPTISVSTIAWELTNRQSPLTAADAADIYQESQRYQIDDAFALADWASETQDGRDAVGGTDNIGNITAPQGVSAAGHLFAVYPTWQAGIDAWFALIQRLYVQGGHATDLLTFALFYVDGLTPQEASAGQKTALQQGYVQNLHAITARLQAHEGTLAAGNSGSGSGGLEAQHVTLASLLPAQLSPTWAGPGALAAAAMIPLAACDASTGSVQAVPFGHPSPLVLAALQLGADLQMGVAGRFNHWGPGTPAGVLSQQGVTQCTDFVASAYERATGRAFPAYPDAGLWWDGVVGHAPGFAQVPATPGSYPEAGDIIVLRDGAAGHVALALGVQLPAGNRPGFVLVGQGNATHVLEKWSLFPDGTLKPPWNYWTQVPGYLRLPALSMSVASQVQPITQADAKAGYDSSAQHDTWWDSVCSAAAFTEVAHAWGITNVTLGQALDRLLAHSPPYITVSGGLMSQDGWDWMAQAFHLQAQVAWHAFTFERLVRQVNSTGIPIIIGIEGGNPASPWGHFLVVVGGDSTHAQVVDSSTWHMASLPSSVFSGPTAGIINEPIWWTGETIVLTPA